MVFNSDSNEQWTSYTSNTEYRTQCWWCSNNWSMAWLKKQNRNTVIQISFSKSALSDITYPMSHHTRLHINQLFLNIFTDKLFNNNLLTLWSRSRTVSYSGSVILKFWPRQLIPWLRVFTVFLSHTRQMMSQHPKTGHDHLLPHPF